MTINPSLNEQQLNELKDLVKKHLSNKVKDRKFHYTPIFFIPNYYIVLQHIFDKFGICDADIEFDKNGELDITVNLVSDIITKEDYPRIVINKINENELITMDNIKSVELPLLEPLHMSLFRQKL